MSEQPDDVAPNPEDQPMDLEDAADVARRVHIQEDDSPVMPDAPEPDHR